MAAKKPAQGHNDMCRARIEEKLMEEEEGRTRVKRKAIIDEALTALLLRYRAAEVDDAYDVAYSDHPIDEPDEWGDLASFRDAAAAT